MLIMQYPSIKKTCVSMFLIVMYVGIALSLLCTTPQDPLENLDDVAIEIVYVDTTASSDSITITIGDTLSFQVTTNHPGLVDSVRIEIEEELDSLFKNIKDTLTISVVATHVGSTTVAVTGYCVKNSVKRDTGIIFIKSIPVKISEEPVSDTVVDGNAVTFIVEATGKPVPAIQWFRDSVAIKGSTSDTLELDDVSSSMDGAIFRARVANIFDTCWSDKAVLTVIGAVARWDEIVWDNFVW